MDGGRVRGEPAEYDGPGVYEVDSHRQTVGFQAQGSELEIALPLEPRLGTVGVAPDVVDANYSVVTKVPKRLLPRVTVYDGIHQHLRSAFS